MAEPEKRHGFGNPAGPRFEHPQVPSGHVPPIGIPHQLPDTDLISRRSILGWIGATAGIVIAADLGIAPLFKEPDKVKKIDYISGETIKTVKPQVKIDRWSLLFDLSEDVWNKVEFTVHRGSGRKATIAFPHSLTPGASIREIDGRKYAELRLLPIDDDLPLKLSVRKKGTNVTREEADVYNLYLTSFHERRETVSTPTRIFAEREEIAQSTFDNLAYMNALFGKFRNENYSGTNICPVYITQTSGGITSEIYNPDLFAITLPEEAFLPPFEQQGAMLGFHAEALSVVDSVSRVKPAARVIGNLKNSYTNVFDELSSVYTMPLLDINAPYTINPNETYQDLFASVVTVMRYFPGEALGRLKALEGGAREAAGEVINAVFGILNFYNPGNYALKELLPDYQAFMDFAGEPSRK